MVNYSLSVTFPGVLDGIIQNQQCHKCRGTLTIARMERGRTKTATQMIANCARCYLEQSIEAQVTLVRR